MKIGYVMAFVSDMEAATTFFRDRIGLPLRFESPGWTEFATEGATLALHASEVGPTGEASVEVAGNCRIGFNVEDLDAFHARMTEQGVDCVQPPAARFGARIAQYSGPDGMVFSVGEARS